jgi:hypothetical protein
MPYEVTYDPECDCVMARIDGELSIQVAKEFLAEISRIVRANGCRRTLDDLRGAELTLSIAELYFAPRLTLEAGIPPAFKSAIVVAEKDWLQCSFLETVAQNQGQIVRVFADPDEARRWLMGQEGETRALPGQ